MEPVTITDWQLKHAGTQLFAHDVQRKRAKEVDALEDFSGAAADKKEMGRQLTMDIVNAQLTDPPTNDAQHKEQVNPTIQHDENDQNDDMAATAVQR